MRSRGATHTHTHTRNVFPKLCKCLSLERLSHTKRFSLQALTQSSWWCTLTSRDTLSLRQTPALFSLFLQFSHALTLSNSARLSLPISPSLSLSLSNSARHSLSLTQPLFLSSYLSLSLPLSTIQPGTHSLKQTLSSDE